MKLSIIHILLILLLLCSCSREESAISEYRDLVQELKQNSSDYSEEEWKDVANRYSKLEQQVEECNFSTKEKKELNRLRGQCAAYMLKAMTQQTKHQIEDAVEQFSDMADGFNEALGDEGFDGLLKDDVYEKSNEE